MTPIPEEGAGHLSSLMTPNITFSEVFMDVGTVSRKNYRADIDGMRAVAVLPVLVFHAGLSSIGGFPIAPGGYVGVDIFFVISGFLISRILYSEINDRSYSIWSFYARRIRRIFPALFAVYLFCLGFVVVFGIGDDAAQTRDTVVASIFFVSNIYFAARAGYFDAANHGNPLLHTWSLSIEEQFYIIFPIILFALQRFSYRIRIAAIAAIMIVSLGLSVLLTREVPDVAYYSLGARAWELGLGGLLAITEIKPSRALIAEMLGVAGLVAIVVAILTFDKTTEFPGYMALLPTLGAAAIIVAGQGYRGSVARLLGWSPIRFIGLISYSLYLWHWPIFVFARQLGFSSKPEMIGSIAFTFAVSWLSRSFVEQPFRRGFASVAPGVVVRRGAVAMVVTVTAALAVAPVNALLSPMTAGAKKILAFDSAPTRAAMQEGVCFLTSNFNFSAFRPDDCLAVEPHRANVLLIGDSHAAQLYQALKDANPHAHILQAAASGCAPLFNAGGQSRCVDLWNFITQHFLPAHKLAAIVVVGKWKESAVDRAITTAEALRAYASKVVIVGPNQVFEASFPRVLALSDLHNDPSIIARYTSPIPAQTDKTFLSRAPYPTQIFYLSYFQKMCPGACPLLSSKGDPVVYDLDHLSLSAARDFVAAAGNVLHFEN